MGNYNWKKHYAIKQQFDKQFSWIPEKPGIYLWERYDPTINKTYFYVGQAQNLRSRRFDYYKLQTGISYPTRHFEASLKAHKDWNYQVLLECKEEELDKLEKDYIQRYMRKDNYITRNDSLTGSDITKTNANRITKIKKEYNEAMKKIYKNIDVLKIGNVYKISAKINKDGTINKRSEDAFRKFEEIINEI